jgi:hypothetical protein
MIYRARRLALGWNPVSPPGFISPDQHIVHLWVTARLEQRGVRVATYIFHLLLSPSKHAKFKALFITDGYKRGFIALSRPFIMP